MTKHGKPLFMACHTNYAHYIIFLTSNVSTVFSKKTFFNIKYFEPSDCTEQLLYH